MDIGQVYRVQVPEPDRGFTGNFAEILFMRPMACTKVTG